MTSAGALAGGAADPHGPGVPDAALLVRLLQFGDSMLPIGGFAFSCGLESAVQTGVVKDAASLAGFVRTAVTQAARGDGVALLCAHRAAAAGDRAELVRIDELVQARKLSGESRTMSLRMGKKLAHLAAQVTQLADVRDWYARIEAGRTPGCFPVVLAVVFQAQGLPARDAFTVHQYGVATTIASAALRLMRIGHLDTQRIVYEASAGTEAAYQRAARTGLDHMAGFAPVAEILAAVHVKAHVRLFMS